METILIEGTYVHMKHFAKSNTYFNTKGFTIVEVLVTVAAIVILVTIASFTATSYTKTSRDSSREAKATVIAHALEKYYGENNEYPSVAFMTGSNTALIQQKLSISDKSAFQFPLANESTVNSIVANTPSTTTLTYAAATKNSSGQEQCQSNTNGYCDAFELRYVKESDNSTVVIKSRYNDTLDIPSIAPPSAPTVSGSYVNNSSIRFDASGSSCGVNTTEYKIRYNTSSANASNMPDWDTLSWSSSSSRTINPGSFINFYIQSIARCTGSQSNASPASQPSAIVTYVKPTPPATPEVSATAIPGNSTSILLSWDAVPTATSYNVTGPGSATSCTSSPCTVTGLAQNTTYTFSVRAANIAGLSNPGTAMVTTTAAPSIPAKISSINVTSSTSTTTTWSWPSSSCNIGTPQYYLVLYVHGYNIWSSPVTTTATSITLDTTTQGTNYELFGHVACANGTEWSQYSDYTAAPLWFRALDPPGIWATATGTTTATLYWSLPPGADSVWIFGGGSVGSCISSPCAITGLTAGSTNTFTVVAVNDITGEYSFSDYTITTNNAVATTPAKISSIWVNSSNTTHTTWGWNHVVCNTGYPQYIVYMYTHGLGVTSAGVTTTGNTITFATNNAGIYHEVMAFAQCVGASNTSGWSAQASSPAWLRPITTTPLVDGGTTNIVRDATFTAPNSMWGESYATSTTVGCPTHTTLQYSHSFTVDDYPYVQFGNYGSATYGIYKTALWQGAMFEAMWYTRCLSNYSGAAGPDTYSDLFGNAHVNETRSQSENRRGKWSRGCLGHSPAGYNICVDMNMTQLPGW